MSTPRVQLKIYLDFALLLFTGEKTPVTCAEQNAEALEVIAQKSLLGVCVGKLGLSSALSKQSSTEENPRANTGPCTQREASQSRSEFYQVLLKIFQRVGSSTQAEPLHRGWRGGEELSMKRQSVASTV